MSHRSHPTNERGVIMAAVLFVLVGLTVMGASAIYTASTEIEIVGNVRRAHQAKACAETTTDAAIAQLPTTSNDINIKLTDNFYARLGHVGATPSPSGGGVTSPPDIGAMRADNMFGGGSSSLTNRLGSTSIGGSAGGSSTSFASMTNMSILDRNLVRVLGHCAPDGASGTAGISEHEQILIFGLGR